MNIGRKEMVHWNKAGTQDYTFIYEIDLKTPIFLSNTLLAELDHKVLSPNQMDILFEIKNTKVRGKSTENDEQIGIYLDCESDFNRFFGI